MDVIHPAQVSNILLTFAYKCYTGVSTFIQVFICTFLMFRCPFEWIFIRFCSYTGITKWKMAQRRSWVSWSSVQALDLRAALLGTQKSPAARRCTGHSSTAMPLSAPSQIVSSAHTRSCTQLSWTGPRDWGNDKSETTGGSRQASNGSSWILPESAQPGAN